MVQSNYLQLIEVDGKKLIGALVPWTKYSSGTVRIKTVREMSP